LIWKLCKDSFVVIVIADAAGATAVAAAASVIKNQAVSSLSFGSFHIGYLPLSQSRYNITVVVKHYQSLVSSLSFEGHTD